MAILDVKIYKADQHSRSIKIEECTPYQISLLPGDIPQDKFMSPDIVMTHSGYGNNRPLPTLPFVDARRLFL